MASVTWKYTTTSEDPSPRLWWSEADGSTARDLSTGTFVVKLVNVESGAVVTPACTVTGYSSWQGTAPNQYNVLVTFTAGAFGSVTAGTYRLMLWRTVSSREEKWPGEGFVVVEAVPA